MSFKKLTLETCNEPFTFYKLHDKLIICKSNKKITL